MVKDPSSGGVFGPVDLTVRAVVARRGVDDVVPRRLLHIATAIGIDLFQSRDCVDTERVWPNADNGACGGSGELEINKLGIGGIGSSSGANI